MLKRTNSQNRVSYDSISDLSNKFFGKYELSPKRQAFKITCIYSFIGSLWILVSDKLVDFLIKERSLIFVISLIKGWVYVIISSILIFLLVFTALKKVTDSKNKMSAELEEKVLARTAQIEVTNAKLEELNTKFEEEIAERKVIENEIKKFKDKLEDKVLERTRQLEEINTTLKENIAERKISEEKLKERESEYKKLSIEYQQKQALRVSLINSVPDLIFYKDTDSVYQGCNKAFEAFAGMEEKKLVGLTDLDIFDKDVAVFFRAMDLEMMEQGVPRRNEELVQYPDGKQVLLDTLKTFYYDPQGNIMGLIGISRDITERKKREEEIIYLSYHDKLTGLYNRRFYEEEIKRLDTERNLPISIIMGDVNGLKIINDAFGHDKGDELLQKAAKAIMSACRADDIVARWGGDEFVILLPKTNAEEAEEIVKRIKELYSNEYVNTIRVSISLGWDTKTKTDEDINMVLKSTEDYMYKHKIIENEGTRGNTIRTIINTLHEKNPREEQHSRRVSELCQKIGTAIGFSETEVSRLRVIGLLHDIGKIAINEGILNKPGRLTQQEQDEMKRHPDIGYRILSSSYEMLDLADCILAHHERWDGTGYPKGLKGEAIPRVARIIALADSYDAMTSARSYRKAMSKEAALAEIRNNAGIQFDPEIARIFVERVLLEQWDYDYDLEKGRLK